MDDIEEFYNISLTEEEGESLYTEYKERKKDIEMEFSLKIGLNNMDIKFLLFAVALQILRQCLLTGELGKSFNKSERVSHDDSKIKEEIKKRQAQFSSDKSEWATNSSKKGYRTWKEIAMTMKVPYDATNGSSQFGLGLHGKNHRLLTLGHDPILGWIFGTLNIITDTMTLTDLQSYKVNLNGLVIEKPVFTPQVFKDGIESVMEEWYRLPAAVFAQGVHLKSDKFTKAGLPVPILGVFSKELAGDLYKNQYDSLCVFRDIKTIGEQAMFSTLINMIIGLIHGLYYEGKNEVDRKLYEVKTRKILLYSNAIASTSNILYTSITKNVKNLDIGGLMVTFYRIISDVAFIKNIKKEFVNNKLNEKYQEEIDELDSKINEMLKELDFN